MIQVSPTRPRFRCNTMGTFDQIELRKVQWNFRVLIQCHVTSLVHAEVRINLIALTYLWHWNIFNSDVQLSICLKYHQCIKEVNEMMKMPRVSIEDRNFVIKAIIAFGYHHSNPPFCQFQTVVLFLITRLTLSFLTISNSPSITWSLRRSSAGISTFPTSSVHVWSLSKTSNLSSFARWHTYQNNEKWLWLNNADTFDQSQVRMPMISSGMEGGIFKNLWVDRFKNLFSKRLLSC